MAIIGAFAMLTITCWLGTIRLWTHSGNSGSKSATDDSTALIPEQGAGSQHGRQVWQSEPSPQLGAYSAHTNPLAISVDAEGSMQKKKPHLFQRPEEIPTKTPKHLAQDGASNTLEFYLPDMVRDYRNRFGKVPMYSYRTTVEDMMRVKTEPDIVTIVNQMVVPRLAELGLARDYDADALRMHFRNQAEKPFIYAKDLSYESVARFAERGVGFAGVRLKISPDTAAFTGEK